MERFNYQSIRAVMAESSELLYLMDCASWGYEMDRKEEQEEEQRKLDSQRTEVNDYGE